LPCFPPACCSFVQPTFIHLQFQETKHCQADLSAPTLLVVLGDHQVRGFGAYGASAWCLGVAQQWEQRALFHRVPCSHSQHEVLSGVNTAHLITCMSP
jgi:O-glycosyl hydrolase